MNFCGVNSEFLKRNRPDAATLVAIDIHPLIYQCAIPERKGLMCLLCDTYEFIYIIYLIVNLDKMRAYGFVLNLNIIKKVKISVYYIHMLIFLSSFLFMRMFSVGNRR